MTDFFATRGRVRAALLAALFAFASLASAATAQRPNIIFILADDLGYGDVGCYGQKLIRTPRLDRMAQEGVRFTQAYSGAPVCAPARCVLMTGRHTGHARIRGNSDLPIHADDATLTEALQKAGYATGVTGKWGLGLEDSAGAPWKKGVDEFLGYLDQTHAHTYYPDYLWKNGRRMEIPENRNGQRRVYSHDLFTDFTLDFIRRHKDAPFFFYAAYTTPHAEVIAPEDEILASYRGKWPEPKPFAGAKTYSAQKEPRAVRAAMITRLDRDVGRILDLLDELKLSENTLVIFTSDNGPITAGGQDPEFFDSNGPLRDLKFTLYEGGIREPFIARWPGHVARGAESAFVTDFTNMFPTFAEMAAAQVPAGLDGVSILPTLIGQPAKQKVREYFYWESAPQQAVRRGDWKLFRAGPDKAPELYNLATDIGEQHNVAAEHADIVAQLTKIMATAHVDNPDFPLGGKRKKEK